jgi:hypothetical protein
VAPIWGAIRIRGQGTWVGGGAEPGNEIMRQGSRERVWWGARNETDLLELGGDEPVSGIVRQASWVCGNETGLLEPGRVCGNETGLLEPGNETGLLEPGYAAFLQNAGLGRGGTQSVALGWYTVSRWDTGRR